MCCCTLLPLPPWRASPPPAPAARSLPAPAAPSRPRPAAKAWGGVSGAAAAAAAPAPAEVKVKPGDKTYGYEDLKGEGLCAAWRGPRGSGGHGCLGPRTGRVRVQRSCVHVLARRAARPAGPPASTLPWRAHTPASLPNQPTHAPTCAAAPPTAHHPQRWDRHDAQGGVPGGGGVCQGGWTGTAAAAGCLHLQRARRSAWGEQGVCQGGGAAWVPCRQAVVDGWMLGLPAGRAPCAHLGPGNQAPPTHPPTPVQVFGKSRAEFKAQPAWRQQLAKKAVGLW